MGLWTITFDYLLEPDPAWHNGKEAKVDFMLTNDVAGRDLRLT